MGSTTPTQNIFLPSLPTMAPVSANKEGRATVQVLASGTNPEPSYDFFQEPNGLTEPPIMQPFGENVDIFGHGGNPDCPDLPNLPNGTNNTAGLSGFCVPGIGLPSEWANSEAIATPFPSSRTTINNRFVKQDDALFDEGYDYEGGLPFHNDITGGNRWCSLCCSTTRGITRANYGGHSCHPDCFRTERRVEEEGQGNWWKQTSVDNASESSHCRWHSHPRR